MVEKNGECGEDVSYSVQPPSPAGADRSSGPGRLATVLHNQMRIDSATFLQHDRSLTTQAFEQLRADILSGALMPCGRLRIQGLSKRYQVGATAVREALSRLVADGLVDAEEQKGFCVAPISRQELLDLTRTRIQIEQLALRQSLEQGDIEWESTLVGHYHHLAKAPLPLTESARGPWANLHRRFHEALLAGCGSAWLMRLCGLLYDKSERYRNLAEHYTSHKNRDVDEHSLLLEAALSRDADKACQLLATHFDRTTGIILKAGIWSDAEA